MLKVSRVSSAEKHTPLRFRLRKSFVKHLVISRNAKSRHNLGKQLNLPTDKAALRSILNTIDLSKTTVLPPSKSHQPKQQLGGRTFWHSKRTSQA